MQPMDFVGYCSCEVWMTWVSQYIFLFLILVIPPSMVIVSWDGLIRYISGILLGMMEHSTTECEWGNMGLQTLLAVFLGLQGEQGLGWGQLCEWQGREEEGWWALHYTLKHLSQPATWSALLLDCPLWASQPPYWNPFKLISVTYREYTFHLLYTLFCKALSSQR